MITGDNTGATLRSPEASASVRTVLRLPVGVDQNFTSSSVITLLAWKIQREVHGDFQWKRMSFLLLLPFQETAAM